MTQEIITKEEVSNNNPLQYKIKIYKTVKDINNTDVEILDSESVVNMIELSNELLKINEQISDLISKKTKLENRIVELTKL